MARHGRLPHVTLSARFLDYFASGQLGRLFGGLPPFSSDTPTVRAALMEIGRPQAASWTRPTTSRRAPPSLITDPN